MKVGPPLLLKQRNRRIQSKHYKLLILAQNIYGKYPPSFATTRIKYCLKVIGKIPRDTMRSSISLDDEEKLQLEKSLKSIGMKI